MKLSMVCANVATAFKNFSESSELLGNEPSTDHKIMCSWLVDSFIQDIPGRVSSHITRTQSIITIMRLYPYSTTSVFDIETDVLATLVRTVLLEVSTNPVHVEFLQSMVIEFRNELMAKFTSICLELFDVSKFKPELQSILAQNADVVVPVPPEVLNAYRSLFKRNTLRAKIMLDLIESLGSVRADVSNFVNVVLLDSPVEIDVDQLYESMLDMLNNFHTLQNATASALKVAPESNKGPVTRSRKRKADFIAH